MTCCSTESSFLERRCSAITLGLSSFSRGSSRRASRDMYEVESGHPGIHIIEPTPKSSPCPSERQTYGERGARDHIKMLDRFKRKRHDDNSIDSITEYPDENNHNHQYRSDNNELSENVVVNSNSNTPQSKTLVSSENPSHQPVIRRAPLASLSSFKMSSIECQDSEEAGASGSVFDESCADTDDDMEQFSTDSDEISLQSPPLTDQHLPIYNVHEVNGKHESSLDKNCDVVVNIDKNDGDDYATDAKRHQPQLNKVSNSISVFSFGESENIERQRSNDKVSTTRPASYSGCISSSASDKKSNSSECVTINVVELKNDDKSSLKPSAPPSSVILEMPVLAKQADSSPNESAIINPDPSVPGTSRKWSKETLF